METIGHWVKAVTISLAHLSGRSGQKLIDFATGARFLGVTQDVPQSISEGRAGLSP